MPEQEYPLITEQDVDMYYRLNEMKKEIEKKMKAYNQRFQHYFDRTMGANQKGEVIIGKFKLQRQIRKSISYDNEKTVQRLEELNLHDCIQVVKKPDQKKIESAIELGIIDGGQINDCRVLKNTKAILVRKI
mgnify:CR=1 FL=1